MITFELVIGIITLLVGTGVFGGIFHIGRKLGGHDVRLNQVDRRLDDIMEILSKLPCTLHDASMQVVKDDNVALKKSLEEISSLAISHDASMQVVKDDNLTLKKSLEEISSLTILHDASIQQTKEDIVEIKVSLKTHESFIQQMKEDIVAIRTFLMTKNPKSSQAFSQKNSPTELNTAGLLLFENLEGKPFLDDNEELFFKAIADKNPKTHLDIETYAFEVLIENANNDIFNNMKDIIYNMLSMEIKKGDEIEKYNVTMNDACYILSIELRNRYIAKFPFSKT